MLARGGPGSGALLALALLLLRAAAWAAPGDLDQSFGAGGRVVTDLGSDDESVRALAVRSDGRVLAAGYTTRAGGRVLAVVRYDRDGRLDPTFGDGGIALHDLGPGDDEGLTLLIQPDGRPLLGAASGGAGRVVRLTRGGGLDPAFGDGGIAAATRGPVTGLARLADGSIVAGADDELVRLAPDGSLDPGFGRDGSLAPFGGRALLALADGSLVGLGGRAAPPFEFEVWRATAGGRLDTGFGTGAGRTDVFPNPGAARGFATALEPDGRVVVAGYREGEAALARRSVALGRLRADGRFDPSFDGDGKLLTHFNGHDSAHALVRQADGRYVVAGDACRLGGTRTTCPSWTFALARYAGNGALDASFGDGGQVTTAFPAAARADAHAFALAQQPDGDLIAAGVASAGGAADFALARYQAAPEATLSPTPSATPGPATPSRTASRSPTPARSGTPTRTRSPAATATVSATPTRTATLTFTPETPPTCPAAPPLPALATPCPSGCPAPALQVADINTAPPPCAAAHEPALFLPAALRAAGDAVFFLFDDCHTGIELWHSDGTAAGTHLVRDIRPGPLDTDIRLLGALGDRLIFLADDGERGLELWRSDGTADGTAPIVELAPGPAGIAPGEPTVAGGMLYFVLGTTLWHSDGTAAGTAAVRDFPRNGFSDLPGPTSLTAFAGALFFVAPGAGGDGLWRSNGTAAGTGLVRLLGGSGCVGGRMLAAADGLFLRGFSLTAGCELWRSDGTAAGTQAVADINPGPLGSNPEPIAALGGTVVLAASTADRGREPWRSDGTAAGTLPLADLSPGPGDGLGDCDAVVDVVAGGRAFFLANDGRGCELWRSDGTAAGTQLVRDLAPGPTAPDIGGLTAVGDLVVFAATTPAAGREPWRSDGSAAGTLQLADLAPGAADALPDGFPFVAAPLGGAVVFAAKDGSGASLLWRSDGTAASTAPILDFAAPGSQPSNPSGFAPAAGGVVVGATDADGASVWRALASVPAAARLAQLDGGAPPRGFAPLGAMLLYVSETPPALWRTDGIAGAALVRALADGSVPDDPIAAGGTAFFFVRTGDRAELWRSDGTTAGTIRIAADLPGAGPAVPFGARIFFAVGSGAETALWSSDGTAAGTRLMLRSGAPISELTVSGERLYFVANSFSLVTGARGRELWVGNGTAAGTVVIDVEPGPEGSDPRQLVDVGGTLFFTADDAVRGRELWRSDGTAAGTRLVRDLRVGRHGASPDHLTAVGDRLFFSADDGCTGRALWVTGGGAADTRLLARVAPLSAGAAAGMLVFAAYEPASGVELWLSDGTPAGTARLADIAAGAASSSPERFTVSGDHLYFAAGDGVSGREVWAVRLDALVPPPTATPTATPPRTPTSTASPTVSTPTGTPTLGCPGDCLGDGVVEVADLIAGVNVALERAPLATCANLDRDGDGRVDISELIGALNHALNGCP